MNRNNLIICLAQSSDDKLVPEFLRQKGHEKVIQLLKGNLDHISGDSLIKIVRQLNFWIKENSLSESDLLALTERLVHTATWRKRYPSFQVPKVRFGRTELDMPIITCGTMRFQHTWMPDFLPIAISKKKVLETSSQENLLEIVRQCLRLGINHFETCRFYGTSEVQLMHALSTLMERGEIKRSDFILQTKIPVRSSDKKDFEKFFNQSWEIFEKLGHIDLMSFWCVSKHDSAGWILSDAEDGLMAAALEWKKQGKIKHIGFSTHGSADVIMKLIESNKFDFVNLHYHFFGSYHAEGTPDTKGGHGNLACVEKALELDMGVFGISPVDKGGRLYQPSSQVARTLGPNMSPISFASLHAWETAGIHTVSVGFARPEDLDEILEAAEFFAKKQEMKPLLQRAETRLVSLAEQRLGKEWVEKGLLNVPSCYEESAKGVGIGQIIWCYNMIHAYGMYDTARSRYTKLETSNKWNNKKSFEENRRAM
jgi:predicted aldo/keto reductase-like oxidoreductase